MSEIEDLDKEFCKHPDEHIVKDVFRWRKSYLLRTSITKCVQKSKIKDLTSINKEIQDQKNDR